MKGKKQKKKRTKNLKLNRATTAPLALVAELLLAKYSVIQKGVKPAVHKNKAPEYSGVSLFIDITFSLNLF